MSDPSVIEIYFYPISIGDSISTFLSAVATCLVVILGSAYKIHEKPLGKMILTVNFLDLIFCLTKLSVFVFPPSSTPYCKVLQAFSQSSLLASILWGTFFGHVLFRVVKYQRIEAIQSPFKWYVLISVVTAGGLGLATAFTEFIHYSDTKKACVHPVTAGTLDVTNLVFGVIPIGTCCFSGIAWYVLAAVILRNSRIVLKGRDLLALLVYPGIIIICWMPELTVNMTASLVGFNVSDVLNGILQNIFLLQGFLDAVVYGMIPNMREICKGRKSTYERPSLSIASSKESEYFPISRNITAKLALLEDLQV